MLRSKQCIIVKWFRRNSSNNSQKLTAYQKFQDAETVDVSLIMAADGDATHIDNLITIAENRKDAVVFASPERSDVVNVADDNTLKDNALFFNVFVHLLMYHLMLQIRI